MLCSIYAVLRVHHSQCMLCLVYIVRRVCCTLNILYTVYAVLGVSSPPCILNTVCADSPRMLYSGYAVLCVWCTQRIAVVSVSCVQYSLYLDYAVLSIETWLQHGGIVQDDVISCAQGKVELRVRKREISEHWGNHHEKLELNIILCTGQLTIPYMEIWLWIQHVNKAMCDITHPTSLGKQCAILWTQPDRSYA
jgi:hypothetical protein